MAVAPFPFTHSLRRGNACSSPPCFKRVSPFLVTTVRCMGYYCPHFAEEETEASENQGTSKAHKPSRVAGLEFERRVSATGFWALVPPLHCPVGPTADKLSAGDCCVHSRLTSCRRFPCGQSTTAPEHHHQPCDVPEGHTGQAATVISGPAHSQRLPGKRTIPSPCLGFLSPATASQLEGDQTEERTVCCHQVSLFR